MPSLRPEDRVSLCRFSFADGRRCLTPRSTTNPHFCFHHAQQEAQSQAAEKLGQDLAYFFSGNYLSACDLSSALARLLTAVARGHIKPRHARTMAYLAQTLAQTIHLSQHEYINAFGTDAWRQAVRNSVKQNADYTNDSPAAPSQPTPTPAPTNSPQPPVAPALLSTLSLEGPVQPNAAAPAPGSSPASTQPPNQPPPTAPTNKPAAQPIVTAPRIAPPIQPQTPPPTPPPPQTPPRPAPDVRFY